MQEDSASDFWAEVMRLNKLVALPMWTFWCMGLLANFVHGILRKDALVFWTFSEQLHEPNYTILLLPVSALKAVFLRSFIMGPVWKYKCDQTTHHTLGKFGQTYQMDMLWKRIITECRCAVTCKSWSEAVSPEDTHEYKKFTKARLFCTVLYPIQRTTRQERTNFNDMMETQQTISQIYALVIASHYPIYTNQKLTIKGRLWLVLLFILS